MSQPTMKQLLEAMDGVPKVDQPKNAYSNSPREQVLDYNDFVNSGDDLHKSKKSYKRTQPGDNPRALEEVNLKKIEEKLAANWRKLKLAETKKK